MTDGFARGWSVSSLRVHESSLPAAPVPFSGRDWVAAWIMCFLILTGFVAAALLVVLGVIVTGRLPHALMLTVGLALSVGSPILVAAICQGALDMSLKVAVPGACASVAGVALVAIGSFS